MNLRLLTLFSYFILFIFVAQACKSTAQSTQQPTMPMENYNATDDKPVFSTVNIPVNIESWEIEKAVNNRINGAFYEDYSYDDNGGDDLMVKASKSAYITIKIDGNYLYYRVPVNIWIKKRIAFAEFEATGELALNFKTYFNISEDWSLETNSTVENYQWIKPMALKTGLGDIPVTYIANRVVESSRETISKAIDKQVRENMNLKTYVQDAWTTMQQPVLLSDAYRAWVKITPQSLSMTPLKTVNDRIATTIAVESIAEVSLGEKPNFRTNSYLPPFRYTNTESDDFAVNLATDVPFAEAERIAKLNIVGQTFTSGSKSAKVEDIKIYGHNEKMVINAKLSGSYNGNIYFTGKPYYDPTEKIVTLQNFDYDLDTKNFLFKSAGWLFHGTIKKKMADSMKFPVIEKIDALKTMIQDNLKSYQINSKVLLNGILQDINIERTYLSPNSIRIHLTSNGKLNLMVKGLE